MSESTFLRKLRSEDYRNKSSFKKMEKIAEKLFQENADIQLGDQDYIFGHVYNRQKKYTNKESQEWGMKQREYINHQVAFYKPKEKVPRNSDSKRSGFASGIIGSRSIMGPSLKAKAVGVEEEQVGFLFRCTRLGKSYYWVDGVPARIRVSLLLLS